MSFVIDQVRQIDSQLDRLQMSSPPSRASSPFMGSFGGHDGAVVDPVTAQPPPTPVRVKRLRNLIRGMSATTSPHVLVDGVHLSSMLAQFEATIVDTDLQGGTSWAHYEDELEWLLVGKAAAQTYGILVKTLMEETLPLSEELRYWNEVLGSYSHTAVYSVQTSPFRLWHWCKMIYTDSCVRLEALRQQGPQHALVATHRISRSEFRASIDGSQRSRCRFSAVLRSWRQFYGLVRTSMRASSIGMLSSDIPVPFAQSRADAKEKQWGIRRLREMTATGLGILMNECLRFNVDSNGNIITLQGLGPGGREEWKEIVESSVALMESLTTNVTVLDMAVSDFEDSVFAGAHQDPADADLPFVTDHHLMTRQAVLSRRLHRILDLHIPAHFSVDRRLAKEYGRPPMWLRYWLPAAVLLACSGTILGVVSRRRAAIVAWIRDAGQTTVDFWFNWVIEPVKKIIGTIRHDKDSDLALMSKRSLEADRESLERMVVDFSVDHSAATSAKPLNEPDIASIRAKVKQGDLTPVLRAYEHDLRRPFLGTVRGDLVRALLVQIQKTKVDVEIAISGIDSLLKSQELVFGFVGLTPGVLVCLGTARWLGGLLNNRRGLSRGKRQGTMIGLLRNIDRIFAKPSAPGSCVLSYKDHGLLLCQVHELDQHARRYMPRDVYREFTEEIHELEDVRIGVDRQQHVVARIRWAYGRWIR
ncbi:MAG: Nuclear control of ATPase protein 2 [Lichina confinis]|nr:MAG: Nuclear control of ATPase protein 2 [Lichina confinis]